MGREETYLDAGNFDLVAQTRERTGPIVRHLVELSAMPGVAEFRTRVAALVGRIARHSLVIEEKMQELGDELRRTDQAHQRASQLGPAYVRNSVAAVPRFSAAG